MVNVFALIDAEDVSSPCRLLFQVVNRSKETDVRFVLGVFLNNSLVTSPAIEEAKRRGFSVEVLYQKSRYDPRPIANGWQVIRDRQVTLLESHGYKSAFVAWCLKHLTGLPWVAFSHGYTSDSENRRIAFYNRLDRWLMKRADRVLAVSDATRQLLQNAGVPRERIGVTHNAIDAQEYRLSADGTKFRRECGAGPDDVLIGVIGRLSQEKGQALFVRAFREVVQVVPNAKAVLIGEGPDREMLQTEARTAGLEECVRFAGYQSDISGIYAALDVVVLPSLSEGLPMVLLEAMLHRKAVVATAVGGIPEVMQGDLSKVVVQPGDIRALAQAMIQVLQEPSLRADLGATGFKRVAEVFSSERRTHEIVAVYKQLLHCPGYEGIQQ